MLLRTESVVLWIPDVLLRWFLHGQYQQLYDEPARDSPRSEERTWVILALRICLSDLPRPCIWLNHLEDLECSESAREVLSSSGWGRERSWVVADDGELAGHRPGRILLLS